MRLRSRDLLHFSSISASFVYCSLAALSRRVSPRRLPEVRSLSVRILVAVCSMSAASDLASRARFISEQLQPYINRREVLQAQLTAARGQVIFLTEREGPLLEELHIIESRILSHQDELRNLQQSLRASLDSFLTEAERAETQQALVVIGIILLIAVSIFHGQRQSARS